MERYYPQFADPFGRLLERLAGRPVAVIGHARPDGDCIGSQVALARILKPVCSHVVCVNPDAVPRRLAFLAEGMEFIRPSPELPGDFAAVYTDCADRARAGDRLAGLYPSAAGNIDHHLSNAQFGEVAIVDPESAATCEILAGLFFDRGLTVDRETARALYAGILTDTGQFRFNSTSRRCFALAGELVTRGASPQEAGYELYERETAGKLQLLQRFLASLTLECGGRVCIGVLPNGIFEETGTTAEDTEGLVDYARCIEGVDIGVLIEEKLAGTAKASLRAKDPAFRVDLVAAQFSGGGHACAAGLNLKAGAENFRERLVAALAARLAVVDAARTHARNAKGI